MSTVKKLPYPSLDNLQVEHVLRALGDPVRLQIVRTLASSNQALNCSAFGLTVSKSTSTHHFRVLRESGVIRQYDRGTSRYSELCSADLDQRFPGLLGAILSAVQDDAC